MHEALPFGALLGSLVLAAALPVVAAPPLVNVGVEWRVVSASELRERQARVLGAGGVALSTQDASRQADAVHSLTVLNGGKARLYVGQSVPQTTWQFLFSAPGNSTGAALQQARLGAAPPPPQGAQLLSQTVWIDLGQGLTVQPRWPGGKAPAEVQIEAVSRQPLGAGGLLGTSGYSPEGRFSAAKSCPPCWFRWGNGCPLRTVRSKARNAHAECCRLPIWTGKMPPNSKFA